MSKMVVVGLSGGVDSAVSAYLLKQQGYRVVGLFMNNWEETTGECTAEKDLHDVVSVCTALDIPHYTVNFAEQYWDSVFADLIDGLKKGITPNPDILCNREIKFRHFFDKALELGADYLATGHYCQTDGKHLLKGMDTNKDQSYFLHAINGEVLDRVLFPIGHLPKNEVRAIAKSIGLNVATKKDSTGICFIGKRKFAEFMSQYIKGEPGEMVDPDGKVIGTHQGIPFYTIGQRKGLRIGGPGEAWFVADKDVANNRILVVQGEDHPALLKQEITATAPTWIDGPPPTRCTARIRYRQIEQPCTVTVSSESVHVRFDEPQRAVTPGQAVVFYDGQTCIGGATI
jgi:tRNA-specific 2-thiouridylase